MSESRTHRAPASGWRAAVLGGAAMLAALLALHGGDPRGATHAMVFPPGWGADRVLRALSAADIPYSSLGGVDFIALVPSGAMPAEAVAATGALFHFAVPLPGGCFPSLTDQRS